MVCNEVCHEIQEFAEEDLGFTHTKDLTYRGALERFDHEGVLLFRFYLEINFSLWPRLFPSVREVDGRIQHSVENHVYPSSGQLCLTTKSKQQELIRDGSVRSLDQFLNLVLVPHLVRQDQYLNGNRNAFQNCEYSHGPVGYMEDYVERLGLPPFDAAIVVSCFLKLRSQRKSCSGNCICSRLLNNPSIRRKWRTLWYIDRDIIAEECGFWSSAVILNHIDLSLPDK